MKKLTHSMKILKIKTKQIMDQDNNLKQLTGMNII